MGIFFSSSKSNTVTIVNSLTEFHSTSGFSKVLDVFVKKDGTAQILVSYSDQTVQFLGTDKDGNIFPGPKFNPVQDLDKTKLIGLSIKLRQQNGMDSGLNTELEHAIRKSNIVTDYKLGYDMICTIAKIYRETTNTSKEDFEEC